MRAVEFAGPAMVRGDSYPGRGGRRQKHFAGSLPASAGLPGRLPTRAGRHFGAALGRPSLRRPRREAPAMRRCATPGRAYPRAAAGGTEGAALTSGVPAMPLPARQRHFLRQQGSAGWHRITLAIGTARGRDLAGRLVTRPHAPTRQSADGPPLPCHLWGRAPALSATPVRMADRGPLATGKLGRLALASRWDTPDGETCAACEASPVRRFRGSEPRSQSALLDLAFRVRSRVRR